MMETVYAATINIEDTIAVLFLLVMVVLVVLAEVDWERKDE